MLHQALQEADDPVVFIGELVAQLVADGQDSAGANSVYEQGVRTVEGVDEAAAADGSPAFGLDCAG
ncbi:hypothetical protein ES708_31016 [subsurface metagenome]